MKTANKLIPVLFLLFFGVVAVSALFHPGFYTSHDGEHQVIRLYRFAESLKDGQFPVRWAKDLDNGYGYPLFNFTYQTPWFIGIPLLKLGFSLTNSIKGIFIIGYLLSGLFMYLWLKRKTGNVGGFLGAFLYLWAPYRFSNIFVRASLGEATVFMFLPLLFWGIEKAAEKKNSLSGIVLIALGLSGVILSHLMGLIIFALPVLFWIIINILNVSSRDSGDASRHSGNTSCHSGESRNLYNNIIINIKALKNIISGMLLGILLSSYYLFPAILEKGFTRANDTLTSHYKDHFVTLSQSIYSKWDYGFDFPGTVNDAMSFQLGIAQWLVIALSFLLLVLFIFKIYKKKSFPKLLTFNYSLLTFFFCLVTFAYSLFMMLPVSTFFWQLIVKYSYFDFPWRFLGLSVFSTAVCGAYLIHIINQIEIKSFFRGVMHYAPTIIIILIALYTNRNHLRVNQYVYNPDSFYMNNLNTTNQYDEYRPKTLDLNYIKVKRNILEKNSDIKISNKIYKSGYLLVEGKAKIKTLQKINIAYFPGWQISIDNKKQKNIKSGEGVMEVNIPKGNFTLKAEFTDTPIRKISNILSLFSLLLIIILIVIVYCKKPFYFKM